MLASLALFVGVAQADTNNFSLESNGQATLYFSIPAPDTLQGPPIAYYFYKGTYPAGSLIESSVSNSNPQYPVAFLPGLVSTSTVTANINLEPYGSYYGNGDYWIEQVIAGATTTWESMTRSGGAWVPQEYTGQPIGFNSLTNTRFTDVSVTGTSTVLVDVDYFLDLAEIDRTVNEFNPTQIAFRTALRPSSTFSSITENINNTVAGTSTASTTFTGLVDGVYDLNITFANNGTLFGQTRPFEQSYVYTEFTIASGTLQSVGTIEFYDGTSQPNPETNQPCGIGALSGCLINATMYLVYPSSESLEQFTVIYDTMSGKFPFAYFTDFNDSILSVFTASTTHSLALEVPFGDYGTTTIISAQMIEDFPLTNTIRTILGAIIWLMLGATIYRRTYRIFNHNSV